MANIWADEYLGLPTFLVDGTPIPVAERRPKLNLIGDGVSIVGADNPAAGRVDLTITATGGGGGSGDATSLLGIDLDAAVGTPTVGEDGYVITYDHALGAYTLAQPPGAAGGYSTIQEDGVNLTQRSTLDFVGAFFTASDTGSKTQVVATGNLGSTNLVTSGTITGGTTGILTRSSADSTATLMQLRKDRGGGIVANNDSIGAYSFRPHDGSTYQITAQHVANVSGTPSAGNVPTRVRHLVGASTAGLATYLEAHSASGSSYTQLTSTSDADAFIQIYADDGIYLGSSVWGLVFGTANFGIYSAAYPVFEVAAAGAGATRNLGFFGQPTSWNDGQNNLFVRNGAAPSAVDSQGASLWTISGTSELRTHRMRFDEYLLAGTGTAPTVGDIRLAAGGSLVARGSSVNITAISTSGNGLLIGATTASSTTVQCANGAVLNLQCGPGGTTGASLQVNIGSNTKLAVNNTGLGFNGATPIARPTYTPTNVTTDRSYDADTVAIAELADVVGTLIADLQLYGLLQ